MINILFLDDEESILSTYRRMLRGYEVNGFYAASTKEAIKLMSLEKMDLIISDYRLEQETGLEFLKRMRTLNHQIPMIIISGYADEEFIKNAMELNIIQDYFIKPMDIETFRKMLKKFIPEGKL